MELPHRECGDPRGSLGNYQLLDNGVLNEKSVGGPWRQVMTGVESLKQGPSGSIWASDIVILKTDGTMWMAPATTGVFTEFATGISNFAFGNASTWDSNYIWALSGTNLEYDSGKGFVKLESNISSFQIASSGSTYGKEIFTLSTTGVLAYDLGSGFVTYDSSVVSFEFGNAGTTWANYIVDLHVDGNLNEATSGSGLFQIDHYVSSFEFGNAGTTYASYLFALHNINSSGNLPPPDGEEYELTYSTAGSKTPTFKVLAYNVGEFAVGEIGTSWAGTLFVVEAATLEYTSATFASPAAVGPAGFAFGFVGNGGGNYVFFGALFDTQIPGTSGPGTGFIPIYPNTGGEDPELTGNPPEDGGFPPYTYWDGYIYYGYA